MRIPFFTITLLAGIASSLPARALESTLYGLTGFGLSTFTAESNVSPAPDSRAIGMHFALGYRAHPNVAVEFSAANLGRVSGTTPAGAAKWALTNYSYSVLGLLPQGDASAWFLRLGLYRSTLIYTSPNGSSARAENKGWGQSVGWQKDFSRLAGWRLEYERLPKIGNAATTGTFSVNTFYASIYYGF